MKSLIYTILLSKSDFSFALLLVTFEPLDIHQSYIPLLKALMCGINAVGAQGSGCMFTLRHAPLKMAVLLHKTEKVWDSFSETVNPKFPRLVLEILQKLSFLEQIFSFQPVHNGPNRVILKDLNFFR